MSLKRTLSISDILFYGLLDYLQSAPRAIPLTDRQAHLIGEYGWSKVWHLLQNGEERWVQIVVDQKPSDLEFDFTRVSGLDQRAKGYLDTFSREEYRLRLLKEEYDHLRATRSFLLAKTREDSDAADRAREMLPQVETMISMVDSQINSLQGEVG